MKKLNIWTTILAGAALFSATGYAQPKTAALIFNGDSTAYGDADSIGAILDSIGLSHQAVDSQTLNNMSVADLENYGMIIWPGGYAGQMAASLSPTARDNVRQAVSQGGVSYVGICAGSFIAAGTSDSGLALIPNTNGGFPYYHLENEGTDDAIVHLKLSDGSTKDLLWWGGPALPDVPGGVVARYTDTNQAALTEQTVGKGLVILSAAHPEAPQNWFDKLGLTDPNPNDFSLAQKIFQAALNHQPMKAMN